MPFVINPIRLLCWIEVKLIILIGIGGFVGTILRYLISGVPYRFLDTSFPLGTLLVNFLGALLIGLVMEFSLTRSYIISDTTRIFVTIGILGGQVMLAGRFYN